MYIDAPRGAVNTELQAELTAHREEILVALSSPPDPLADPIFAKLTDRLWTIIKRCKGECFTDEHGQRWDILGTASRLYLAPWSMEWLDEVALFAKAWSQRRAGPLATSSKAGQETAPYFCKRGSFFAAPSSSCPADR